MFNSDKIKLKSNKFHYDEMNIKHLTVCMS